MKKRPRLEIEPRLRINFGRQFTFGPGKAELMENIQKTGSIAEAAKAMGMSYMRAWMLVKSINRGLPVPFVQTARGGRMRGGAHLTETGSALLALYRKIERHSLAAIRSDREKLQQLLDPS